MNVNDQVAARDQRARVTTYGTLALLALLPSWLGLLGGWYWMLDLLANFRWQYLLASALVLVWAAWRRQRRILVLAALTFTLNAVLIGRLAVHSGVDRAGLAGDFSLRVVSLNVLLSNRHQQRVQEYLLASHADVILLMEVNDRWMEALPALRAKYPYRIAETRAGFSGIALFSRVPWQEARIWKPDADSAPTIEVRMNYQGRDFVLIGTHPKSPSSPRRAHARDRQMRWLAEHVAREKEPVLLMGDLNSTPWSVGMRLITAGNLDYRSLDAPLVPTWLARSIFAIPIDQVLCTAPLAIARRSIGADVGSDHRPQEISVGWMK